MMSGCRIQQSFTLGVTLLLSNLAIAAPPVVVKTYGQHVGGNIIYTQEVSNTGDREIVSIAIAYDTDYVSLEQPSTRDKGELRVLPLGSNYMTQQIVPSSVSGPSGWTAQIIQIEHNWQYIIWRGPAYPEPIIAPGQTATFRITVPTYDTAYLTGHFSARRIDVNASNIETYNGVMQKLDITPPTLSVSVNPATLWPPTGKLIPITVTLTVQDDYDPAPAIKLESITANEPLASGDIAEAAFGTDDRQFRLRAERKGKHKTGRLYTITYSATDASGNKATASATVTVPHDARNKDERERKGRKEGQD